MMIGTENVKPSQMKVFPPTSHSGAQLCPTEKQPYKSRVLQ